MEHYCFSLEIESERFSNKHNNLILLCPFKVTRSYILESAEGTTKWELIVVLTLVLVSTSILKYWIVTYLLAENRWV